MKGQYTRICGFQCEMRKCLSFYLVSECFGLSLTSLLKALVAYISWVIVLNHDWGVSCTALFVASSPPSPAFVRKARGGNRIGKWGPIISASTGGNRSTHPCRLSLLRRLGHFWRRHSRLHEELAGMEGKGETTKLKKGIKHCQREQTNTETIPVARLHNGRVHWHTALEFEINMTKGSCPAVRDEGGWNAPVGTFPVCVPVCCWDTGCSHCSCQQLEVIVFYFRGSRGLPLSPVQAGKVKANLEGINFLLWMSQNLAVHSALRL